MSLPTPSCEKAEIDPASPDMLIWPIRAPVLLSSPCSINRSRLIFIDLLAAAGQRLWQVLPLSPTGYGNSPYAALSAFAGNPLLISLDLNISEISYRLNFNDNSYFTKFFKKYTGLLPEEFRKSTLKK